MKLSEALSKGCLERHKAKVSLKFDCVEEATAFTAALGSVKRKEQMYLGALRCLERSVRLDWDWNSDLQCHGYYVGREWAGVELEDALFFAGRD